MRIGRIISSAVLFFCSGITQAAYTGLSSEIYAIDAVAGTITYRIYAEFDDPADQLIAVFGADYAPLIVSTTTSFYQDPIGGALSTQINPAFFGLFPILQYDSWFTIGYEDQIDNQLLSVGLSPSLDVFETGGNLLVNDPIGGSWFVTPNISPQALPVAGRVLVAQLTTDGDINITMNLQYRNTQQISYNIEGLTLEIPFGVPGCTDPLAQNFDPQATLDDGSCTYPAPSFSGLTYELVASDAIPGYDTYRVYANFTNPFDELNAIYGQDVTPLKVATTGSFYQDAAGGPLSANINSLFFAVIPTLEFDSWFTIGTESLPNVLLSLGLDYSNFEAGEDFEVNDPIGGAWFVTPGSEPAAYPDALGRVLIAQLTTNGIVDMTVNLQYRAQDGSNPQEEGLKLTFPILTPGCTYATASNFNPLANQDDGSCIFQGCTDPAAVNFNPLASGDDGSCILPISGCTDCMAVNYNPNADIDDGSCLPNVFGCTDPLALNYNPSATIDNASCILPIPGCTDPSAFNFNPGANVDDGTCTAMVFGCIDPSALNFNPSANIDNGSCVFPLAGCTDPEAINFDCDATFDNGTCIAACAEDINGDGFRNTSDLLDLLAVFGTPCP
jgi:hypothetical protein